MTPEENTTTTPEDPTGAENAIAIIITSETANGIVERLNAKQPLTTDQEGELYSAIIRAYGALR